MSIYRALLAVAFIGVLTFSLSACEREGPAERAGKKIDKAVEESGEAIDKAGDKAKEAVEEAGKAIDKAGDKAKEATKQ